ncbi:MAG TPA: beta-ketoacyl-[acyl-carrier-protein] synthase family protein [Stellaceae bacterium]|nr:beta-ketoacyl-[acyl-carrier-protein] synthase family protein [Stellaceae bacterium]
MQPLLLSHFAIVSSLGAGLEATLAALQAGRSGLRPHSYPGEFDTWIGKVDALDTFRLDEGLAPFECRNNRLAAMAMAQDGFAEAVAALREKYGPHRIGLVLGTSTAGIEQTERAYRRRDPETGRLPSDFRYAETHNTFSVGKFVARALDLTGPAIVVSAACATTAKAFGNAARMIAAGFCDAAIVGGADTLCSTTIYGFRSLGLISREPCRPFDRGRDGISIGEASGFAIVEKAAGGRLPPNAVLLRGIGESSDAYHMSTPHPDGAGARLAMERALAAAGMAPDDIDYVNIHGTATPVGDAAEDRALVELFGRETPCSSTKGYTGHTLGAAGIVETIIAALAIQNSFMPGSANTQDVDPALRSRYLTAGQHAPVRRAMSNSFGFGGSNCSLVLERAS